MNILPLKKIVVTIKRFLLGTYQGKDNNKYFGICCSKEIFWLILNFQKHDFCGVVPTVQYDMNEKVAIESDSPTAVGDLFSSAAQACY